MMSSNKHVFLFSSLGSKGPLTARTVHLRRLSDLLQLSIQRYDFQRARRIWAILSRCNEIDWKALWTTGLHILNELDAAECNTQKSEEYLRAMMLHYPNDREAILKELVFRLLLQGKCREALDELELYLPSFPYQDNPTLHIYAGLSSLYLAQSQKGTAMLDHILLRDAQTHLEHAKLLDQDNDVARVFLEKIIHLQKGDQLIQEESEDELMDVTENVANKKRARTKFNESLNIR